MFLGFQMKWLLPTLTIVEVNLVGRLGNITLVLVQWTKGLEEQNRVQDMLPLHKCTIRLNKNLQVNETHKTM
jgi:hypothetical protein